MIVYHFLLQHNTVPKEMRGLSEMSWQSFAFMIMHSCILLSFHSGNYGNKFDESVAPCNTPSVNAVYDGCYYHYLPWGQEKPCVCVECSWEDIAFRLEPINIITRMAEREVSPWWLSFLILTSVLPGKDLYIILFPFPNLYFELVNVRMSPELTNSKYRHSDKEKLPWSHQGCKVNRRREAKSVEKRCSYGCGQSSNELNWSFFLLFFSHTLLCDMQSLIDAY